MLVDVAAGDVDPFTRAARSAAVGAAMTTTYGEGHPMATLGGGVFAVLARADEDPHPPLEALHAEIARRCELLDIRASTRSRSGCGSSRCRPPTSRRCGRWTGSRGPDRRTS